MNLRLACTHFLTATLCFYLTACALRSNSAKRAADREVVQKELGEETSLKEDRDHLAELRKEIPEETRKSNDELALALNMMKQGNENPQMLRDRFHIMVQKKRTVFREKTAKLREKYRSEETKRRDAFLDQQKKKRDAFIKRKRQSKETREFFAEQDRERQGFFADERERRQAFESEVSAQSKDFDAYMRERQKEFDEQYRLYSKKFSEKPKDRKAVTGDEFKRLEESSATPLGTED